MPKLTKMTDEGSRVTIFFETRPWIVFYSDMVLPLIGETGNRRITRVR